MPKSGCESRNRMPTALRQGGGRLDRKQSTAVGASWQYQEVGQTVAYGLFSTVGRQRENDGRKALRNVGGERGTNASKTSLQAATGRLIGKLNARTRRVESLNTG